MARITIPDAMLASMRDTIPLPNTAIIKEKSVVNDGGGGRTVSYAAVSGGTVACRLDPVETSTDQDMELIGRQILEQKYRLTVPHDAPLVAHCRVAVDSVDYEVIQLNEAHDWNVAVRATVQVVK